MTLVWVVMPMDLSCRTRLLRKTLSLNMEILRFFTTQTIRLSCIIIHCRIQQKTIGTTRLLVVLLCLVVPTARIGTLRPLQSSNCMPPKLSLTKSSKPDKSSASKRESKKEELKLGEQDRIQRRLAEDARSGVVLTTQASKLWWDRSGTDSICPCSILRL